MTTGPTPSRGGPPPLDPTLGPTPDPDAATPPTGIPSVGTGRPPTNPDATASIGDPAASAPDPSTRRAGRPDPADSSTAQLLRAVTEDVRSLVQGEIAAARQEVTQKALDARPAAGMLGGSAVLGALAAGTSAVVLVRFLDRILPPTTSAVVATALLGGGAAALARAGVEELRRVGPLVPERTVDSVKADVAAVTDAAAH